MEKRYLTEEQMEYLTVLGVDTSDANMSVDIYLPKMDKKLYGVNNC